MTEARKVIVSFVLSDQKVGEEDVTGLSEFWVDPTGFGIGRKALSMIESTASPNIVVGFATDATVGFYKACEWFVGSSINDKYLVASEPIDDSKFEGKIW